MRTSAFWGCLSVHLNVHILTAGDAPTLTLYTTFSKAAQLQNQSGGESLAIPAFFYKIHLLQHVTRGHVDAWDGVAHRAHVAGETCTSGTGGIGRRSAAGGCRGGYVCQPFREKTWLNPDDNPTLEDLQWWYPRTRSNQYASVVRPTISQPASQPADWPAKNQAA